MKIAQVSPYDVRHPGGVAEHIRHLRAELLRLGHEVVVIAPRSSKGGIEFGDGFYGIGRPVSIPGNGSRVRLTFDVTLYAEVKRLMAAEQFDVVHLHEPGVPVLPHMVLLNSKAVNVATFHAFRPSNPWYTAFKPALSPILGRLDARIAVSEPAREFVSQYFEGPYEIIPNGIDPSRFGGEVEPIQWTRPDAPHILFVGRFDEQRKGFKYLLRALPLVRQQFPTARLVVVGTGNPEKFDGVIEQYQVRGVDFVGFVAPEELPRYYAACSVFCAPSVRGESFGLVLLEAMASGRPVVASDIPGYASVMTNGAEGLLVPPKDHQALALALVRILADQDLRRRFSETGPATAAQYAWPRVAARVVEAYSAAAEAAANASWRRSLV